MSGHVRDQLRTLAEYAPGKARSGQQLPKADEEAFARLLRERLADVVAVLDAAVTADAYLEECRQKGWDFDVPVDEQFMRLRRAVVALEEDARG